MPDENAATPELELLLQRAWFKAEGCPASTVLDIHPQDDMARLDLLKTSPERRRMFYMRTGYEAFLVLENALRAAGKELGQLPSLLDFACGYGRTLRFTVNELAPKAVFASDLLHEAVDFVASTLGVHGFYSEVQSEKIPFPRKFSAISVFSLFSHLPHARFAEFLRALYDTLEPDGVLLLTTISPSGTAAKNLDRTGFTYIPESGIPYLDPEEYGSTFVDPAFMHNVCHEAGIQHVWHLEQELWRIQDVYVIAKQAMPGMERWSRTPMARGAILRSTIDAAGTARAEGYVRIPVDGPDVTEVMIQIGEGRDVPCASREHPAPLPESEGGRFFRQVDWYVEGSVPELLEGAHTIAGVAKLANGAWNCFDVSLLEAEAPG